MCKVILNHNEEGVTLTIPYHNNPNYRYSAMSKGLAYDTLGGWSEYLIKLLTDLYNEMSEKLTTNFTKAVHVDKNLIVFADGSKFCGSTYVALEECIHLLEKGSWRTLLTNHAEFLLRMMLSANRVHPTEQGGFKFQELLSVLFAADHDCIEDL